MFHFHQLFSLEVPLQHRTLEKARKDVRKTQTREKTVQHLLETQVTCSCAWDKVMLDCLSWNKVWTKVRRRQVLDGRQAWRWRRRKGLDWCFYSLLLLVVCLL